MVRYEWFIESLDLKRIIIIRSIDRFMTSKYALSIDLMMMIRFKSNDSMNHSLDS